MKIHFLLPMLLPLESLPPATNDVEIHFLLPVLPPLCHHLFCSCCHLHKPPLLQQLPLPQHFFSCAHTAAAAITAVITATYCRQHNTAITATTTSVLVVTHGQHHHCNHCCLCPLLLRLSSLHQHFCSCCHLPSSAITAITATSASILPLLPSCAAATAITVACCHCHPCCLLPLSSPPSSTLPVLLLLLLISPLPRHNQFCSCCWLLTLPQLLSVPASTNAVSSAVVAANTAVDHVKFKSFQR